MLREYSACLDLPPKDWLLAKFPGIPKTSSSAACIHAWYCYTLSFERILSEWLEGDFGSCRPGFAQPIGLMIQTIVWSQQRAEAKQAELIGMTSVTEVAADIFSRPTVKSASSETEIKAEQGLATSE